MHLPLNRVTPLTVPPLECSSGYSLCVKTKFLKIAVPYHTILHSVQSYGLIFVQLPLVSSPVQSERIIQYDFANLNIIVTYLRRWHKK